MKARMKWRAAPAVIAATAALGAAGCGDESPSDVVESAQDEIQQEAERLTDELPDQARDAREQAENAAAEAQERLDDITNGTDPGGN